MRIESVEIKNFRNIAEARVDLGKINWVFGHNRAGKSSLLSAMRTCLIGECDSSLIMDGAKSTTIKVTASSAGKSQAIELTRFSSKITTPRVNGEAMKRSAYHTRMKDIVGVSRSVLEAVFTPKLLMSLDDRDQIEAILDSVGCNVDWAGAQDLFEDWCISKEVSAITISDVVATTRITGFELLGMIHDSAYSERRGIRRGLDSLNVEAPSIPPDVVQYVRDAGLEKGLREEVSTLRARSAELKAKKDLLSRLSEIGRDPEEEIAEIDVGALKRKGAELRAKRDARAGALDVISKGEQYYSMLSDLLSESSSDTCPMCESLISGGRGSLERRIVLEKANLDKRRRQIDRDFPPPDGAEVQALRDARDNLDRMTSKAQERKELMSAISDTTEGELRLELDQCTGRHIEAKRLMSLISGYKASLAGYELESRRHKELSEKWDNLDTIVKAFKRDVPAKAFDGLKERFVEPFKAALSLFFGDGENAVDFSMDSSGPDNKWSLFVSVAGRKRKYENLSESEKILVSAAAQHAIATAAGASVLIVDAADTMQGALRDAFVRGIYGLADGYETIVIASTIGRVDVRKSPLKKLDGTKLFLVDSGQVSDI
jgi:DNA repair exonuclease SbcCD ATPase subunit